MTRIPVLDLCSHRHESLLHISGIFCAGLQEWDAYLISESLKTEKIPTAWTKILQIDTSCVPETNISNEIAEKTTKKTLQR
jgi:hypothetical protein